MAHPKWNIDDVERYQLPLSSFEQQLDKYEGTKKLAIAFWRTSTASLRNKLARLLPGQVAEAGTFADFSTANPNFKRYEIRLQL